MTDSRSSHPPMELWIEYQKGGTTWTGPKIPKLFLLKGGSIPDADYERLKSVVLAVSQGSDKSMRRFVGRDGKLLYSYNNITDTIIYSRSIINTLYYAAQTEGKLDKKVSGGSDVGDYDLKNYLGLERIDDLDIARVTATGIFHFVKVRLIDDVDGKAVQAGFDGDVKAESKMFVPRTNLKEYRDYVQNPSNDEVFVNLYEAADRLATRGDFKSVDDIVWSIMNDPALPKSEMERMSAASNIAAELAPEAVYLTSSGIYPALFNMDRAFYSKLGSYLDQEAEKRRARNREARAEMKLGYEKDFPPIYEKAVIDPTPDSLETLRNAFINTVGVLGANYIANYMTRFLSTKLSDLSRSDRVKLLADAYENMSSYEQNEIRSLVPDLVREFESGVSTGAPGGPVMYGAGQRSQSPVTQGFAQPGAGAGAPSGVERKYAVVDNNTDAAQMANRTFGSAPGRVVTLLRGTGQSIWLRRDYPGAPIEWLPNGTQDDVVAFVSGYNIMQMR